MADTVLLFDADCGLCRWALARVLAWDRAGRLRPVALQSDEAAALLSSMRPTERMASWHLVTNDGRVRSGGAAVGPLARVLPFAPPVAAIAEAFPRTTDRAYRWVAVHRRALGRLVGALDACAVPTARTRSSSNRDTFGLSRASRPRPSRGT
jgi:predicted DCC family thiol-disulfide oxidoreductase YuxK